MNDPFNPESLLAISEQTKWLSCQYLDAYTEYEDADHDQETGLSPGAIEAIQDRKSAELKKQQKAILDQQLKDSIKKESDK